MRNYFFQSSNISDKHRFIEMEGDLGNAALSGRFIRLNNQVGGAEKEPDILILYKMIVKNNISFKSRFLYQLPVMSFIFIKFSCNDQFQVFPRNLESEKAFIRISSPL